MCRAMRIPLILFVCIVAGPALAATKTAPAAAPTPKELGRFNRWIAAQYSQGGHTVCYAFTRAGSEDPATGNGPVLSVTDRPGGRDEVAISNGPVFPKDFTLPVQVGSANLDFYTSGHDAFARDGKAVIAAMLPASTAVAHMPGSKGGTAMPFSLDGFTAAHDAMGKACPAH